MIFLAQPNVKTLSDSSTNLNISSIAETGHILLSSFPLIFKQVPQARITPLFFMNFLIEPSDNGNFASFTFSTSTPFPSKNIFTEWLFFRASFPNLKQFQQVSASFVFKIIPIFIVGLPRIIDYFYYIILNLFCFLIVYFWKELRNHGRFHSNNLYFSILF